MNTLLARNLLLPAHERLLRRKTFAVARRLEQSQWLAPEELRRLQLAKLNELLAVALERTSYGQLAEISSNWRAASLDDLSRLPIMDKAFLSSHREQMVNRSVEGGPIRYRTGGSTGTPLIFYFDRRRQAWDKAARIRTHRWWGIRPGDREAYIWNSPVELSRQDRLKRVRDWLMNDRLLPASELCEANVADYVARLRRFRPHCLFGYPSAISLLARLASRAGLDLSDLGVRVVFTTAEVLYQHQRELITSAFGGAPVADCYGSREAGFISHQCPEGRMHITSENVIVEFLQQGQPAAPGEDADIVVTQLDNNAMPFIRYNTGDIGQYSTEPCPCGRGLSVMSVVKGRSNDMLLTSDSRWVHSSALHAVLSGIPGIANFQFQQQADLSVRMLLVTDEQFPADGESRLRKGLLSRLGQGADFRIERCDSIPLMPSGKYCSVISQVSSQQLNRLAVDSQQQ